jgi:hypothetical protein
MFTSRRHLSPSPASHHAEGRPLLPHRATRRLTPSGDADQRHGRADAERPERRARRCSLPDLECAQSFWLLGLHDDVRHHGKARPMLCPVQQVLYVLAGPFEDGLHPAVVEVAHPPAHTMQHGHLLARIPEVDALNPPRDQHPKTDHTQTLRPRPSRAGANATARTHMRGVPGFGRIACATARTAMRGVRGFGRIAVLRRKPPCAGVPGGSAPG